MNRYTTTLEDAKLLSLMQEDDINAFTTPYERYWQKLYGVAWYHLKHKQAAEDRAGYLLPKRRELAVTRLYTYFATCVKYAVYRQYVLKGEKRGFA